MKPSIYIVYTMQYDTPEFYGYFQSYSDAEDCVKRLQAENYRMYIVAEVS